MAAVPLPTPIPLQPAVLVVGTDAEPCLRATAILAADRLRVLDGWRPAAPGEDGLPPIVVLLSLGPDRPAEAIEAATQSYPATPMVVVMPSDAPGSALREALRAGASGLVHEDELMEALAPTVRAVAAGQLAVPRSLLRQLAPKALSYREKEILNLMVRGYTNRQIARALFVAESTVKTHLSSAYTKLDARSRAEAAALLLEPDSVVGRTVLGLLVADRVA